MDQTQLIALAALIGAFIGLLIGVLAGKRTSKESKRARHLEQSLSESKLELDQYKNEVQQHFSDTADAFKTMNESYASLHQKLAVGAQALCGEVPAGPLLDGPNSAAVATASVTAEVTERNDEQALEPPLDYAPKKDPEEAGMLTEDFGLRKREASQSANDPE